MKRRRPRSREKLVEYRLGRFLVFHVTRARDRFLRAVEKKFAK